MRAQLHIRLSHISSTFTIESVTNRLTQFSEESVGVFQLTSVTTKLSHEKYSLQMNLLRFIFFSAESLSFK